MQCLACGLPSDEDRLAVCYDCMKRAGMKIIPGCEVLCECEASPTGVDLANSGRVADLDDFDLVIVGRTGRRFGFPGPCSSASLPRPHMYNVGTPVGFATRIRPFHGYTVCSRHVHVFSTISRSTREARGFGTYRKIRERVRFPIIGKISPPKVFWENLSRTP